MMSMRKLVAICVLASSPAFAGEVTGNGDPTPVGSRANSICAFSGLQDGDPPFISTQVQAYGAIVAAMGGRPSIAGPGITCNGRTGLLS